jgi:hypothetical protein
LLTGKFEDKRQVMSRVAAVFSPEVVKPVFTSFNTALLFPWLLMIIVPNVDFTKSVIKSNFFLYLFCAAYVYSFAAATAQAVDAGANISDEVQYLFLEAVAGAVPGAVIEHNNSPSLPYACVHTDPDKMANMFTRPAYAAQDWVHLCTWDYFVGQWIYQQGLEKGIFTRLSLLVTFNTGDPPRQRLTSMHAQARLQILWFTRISMHASHICKVCVHRRGSQA